MAIAPGGAREALFSDDTYKLIWVHHKGFAQLAIDAKVVSNTFVIISHVGGSEGIGRQTVTTRCSTEEAQFYYASAAL